jgi:hypothetical protein
VAAIAMKTVAAFIVLGLAINAEIASAQSRGETASSRALRNDPLISWAATWGDTRGTGVYTCEEWKRYAEKLFKEADKNRNGFLDEQEFKVVQQADKILKNADFAYFDDNKDGRVSHTEFIEKPNPFFARYDRKNECSVSLDSIVNLPRDTKTQIRR